MNDFQSQKILMLVNAYCRSKIEGKGVLYEDIYNTIALFLGGLICVYSIIAPTKRATKMPKAKEIDVVLSKFKDLIIFPNRIFHHKPYSNQLDIVNERNNEAWDTVYYRGNQKAIPFRDTIKLVSGSFSQKEYLASTHWFTYFVTESGKIYGHGQNQGKQLIGYEDSTGADPKRYYSIPIRLDYKQLNASTIKQISCGFKHTLFLTENGTVYSCGANNYFQCGIFHRNPIPITTPTLITLQNVNIKQIHAFANSNLCLSDNGVLYGFGSYKYGLLGNGQKCLKDIGDIKISQVSMFEGMNIIKMECCVDHCCLLNDKNECYLWGDDNYGQVTGFIKSRRELQLAKVEATPKRFVPEEAKDDKIIDVSVEKGFTVLLIDEHTQRSIILLDGYDYFKLRYREESDCKKCQYALSKSRIGIDDDHKLCRIRAVNRGIIFFCDCITFTTSLF